MVEENVFESINFLKMVHLLLVSSSSYNFDHAKFTKRAYDICQQDKSKLTQIQRHWKHYISIFRGRGRGRGCVKEEWINEQFPLVRIL